MMQSGITAMVSQMMAARPPEISPDHQISGRIKALTPKVLALYERGTSPPKIADELRISSNSVRRILKSEGVFVSAKGLPDPIRRAVVADILSGMTYTEVAKKHGVSRSFIKTWVERES